MPMSGENKRIAIVHDWLTNIGGAERVLKAMHDIYPQAPIFVFFRDKKFTDNFLPKADIRTTKYQKLYNFIIARKFMLPFLPLAAESIDLSGYDIVISTAPYAKGLVLRTNTAHIHYCHSPTRQLWDWQAEYLAEKHMAPKGIVGFSQHFLRIWDRHASLRVDYFVANSANTKKRIKKYYGRDSKVVYPPVNVGVPDGKIKTKDYFLIVSRLFPHKNIDISIRAFNRLGWPLLIIGSGPDLKRLKRSAEKNIVFLGHRSDEEVRKYMLECSAFVMPQEEDFGIAPVEALACGKPVLALKRGGALEYIEEGINGEFFDDPREEMLADGARRLKEKLSEYSVEAIKKTALRFSRERFAGDIRELMTPFILSGQKAL